LQDVRRLRLYCYFKWAKLIICGECILPQLLPREKGNRVVKKTEAWVLRQLQHKTAVRLGENKLQAAA